MVGHLPIQGTNHWLIGMTVGKTKGLGLERELDFGNIHEIGSSHDGDLKRNELHGLIGFILGKEERISFFFKLFNSI